MMDFSFSFVIPACNVEKYAAAMVTSLKRQTLPTFEALIVSEKSKDGTWEILDREIGGDSRFQVVHLPCSGSASVSRNYGIEHAHGDYLVFVDGDDWSEPDTLARLQEVLRKTGPVDVLQEDWVLHLTAADGTETVRRERCHALEPMKIYSGREALRRELLGEIHTGSPLQVCRREFLLRERLFQIPGQRFEDDEWMPRLLFAAGSVVYTGGAFYHYRKRADSVTTDADPLALIGFTDNFISFCEFLEMHELEPALRDPWCHWMSRIVFVYFSPSNSRRFPRAMRHEQFKRLMANHGFARFCAVVRHAGISKRILIPLLALARLPGGFAVAEWLYRHVYWPVVITWWGRLKRNRQEAKA